MEDLRIQKTKRDLRKGIIDLLKEQPFEKINVTDICQKSLITRMTFYKYYEDKYHLIDDTINSIKDDIIAKVLKNNHMEELSSIDVNLCVSIIQETINECLKYKDIIIALGMQNSNFLIQRILHSFRSYVLDLLLLVNKDHPFKYNVKLVSSFVFGGFADAIEYWLKEQPFSKEEFVTQVKNILTSLVESELLFKS